MTSLSREPTDQMSVFRVRFEILGGHVHCDVFTAKASNMTFANCGRLVVSKGPEFRDFMAAFKGADFIGKDDNRGIVEACKP